MIVKEIWRYPVKSMLGESLDQARVSPDGVQGDRFWAVVDVETGVSLSAKRYCALLTCSARTIDGEVIIRLPDGEEIPAGSAEASGALSDLLNRQVTTRTADNTETIKHEFPSGITEGEGEPFLSEPGTSAFFSTALRYISLLRAL